MDKIILTDKTEFEIAEGASLGNIKINIKDVSDINPVVNAFQDENLAFVTFTHDGNVTAKYSDMKYDTFFCSRHITEDGTDDGTYDVIMSIRPKTEMEKAIEELKARQDLTAAAIDDLASNMKEA